MLMLSDAKMHLLAFKSLSLVCALINPFFCSKFSVACERFMCWIIKTFYCVDVYVVLCGYLLPAPEIYLNVNML